jgi:hypothetical protein
MKTWVKVLLGLVGLVVLAVAALAAVVGGASWWVKSNADELRAERGRAIEEGQAFAASHDAHACVVEAMQRAAARSGLVEELGHKAFLVACLDKAHRPADFCAGVPAPDAIVDSATWAVKLCTLKGHAGSGPCSRLVEAIQKACAGSGTDEP